MLPPGGGRRAEGVIRTLTAEADRLVTDLAAFAAETGIPALAHGVAPRTIDREGTAAWEASFREIQSKIDEIIADFRFRGEPVGYIGSMKSGWRGPHKGKTRFDPNDFDVDLYVVVDKATFDEIASPYRSLLSKDGTKLMPDAGDPPEIVRLGKEIGRALKAAFPHVRGIEDSVIALRSEQPW